VFVMLKAPVTDFLPAACHGTPDQLVACHGQGNHRRTLLQDVRGRLVRGVNMMFTPSMIGPAAVLTEEPQLPHAMLNLWLTCDDNQSW
jgi:hypothetical protein